MSSVTFDTDDSIVALATPVGRGALGVVRISGPRSLDIGRALITTRKVLEPRRATLSRLRVAAGDMLADSVVITYFPGPHSYTGQDVVEISGHGSPVLMRSILTAATSAGARLARPGEFTLRAFLAGKIDLVQAEAVADLIAAVTPLQARAAFDQLDGTLTRRIAALDAELFDVIAKLEASLDFPDEGYHFIDADETRRRVVSVDTDIAALLDHARRGRLVREGATIVLVGRPNVGKSSLFNALAGVDRAIVTNVPGTTRDLITEPIDIDGLAVMLVDTAGARDAKDAVEREGVARGRQARAVADLIIAIVDRSEPLTTDDRSLLEETRSPRRLIVANKSDLPAAHDIDDAIHVSAVTGDGLDVLRCAIVRALSQDADARESPALTNVRHVSLLADARQALHRVIDGIDQRLPEEFLLIDLQAARARFDEVVGVRTSTDVLNHIFEKFCIGK